MEDGKSVDNEADIASTFNGFFVYKVMSKVGGARRCSYTPSCVVSLDFSTCPALLAPTIKFWHDGFGHLVLALGPSECYLISIAQLKSLI